MMLAAKTLARRASSASNKLAKLLQDRSAVALTEFAFSMPLILSLGMMGTEMAYFSITHMRVSQVAMQVADNASRVGEHDVLIERKVYEDDVIDVFVGAYKLGGGLDILDNGRVILSSLEQNSDGGQWIHWQRCKGMKGYTSAYGDEDEGATGTSFPGMGETGKEITASSGTAVMFVEIAYDYPGLTPFEFITNDEIVYSAAFNVRDSRDLTQIYPRAGTTPATCNVYDTF